METKINLVNDKILNWITDLPLCIKHAGNTWHEDTLLQSHDSTIAGITVSGILKKFEKPSLTGEEARREAAIQAYLSDNSRLSKSKVNTFSDEAVERFELARKLIKKWVATDSLRDDDAWFGKGECFDSHQGRTSPLAKLNKLPFTVTCGAATDGVMLLWRNRQLKRWLVSWARTKGSPIDRSPKGRAEFYAALMRDQLISVVPGNRGETVPKNNKTDRFIGVEPKLNMLLQKTVGGLLRRSLKRAGVDLLRGQLDHQLMIRSQDIATIDLKGASNSNHLDLVQKLLPGWLYEKVLSYRSPSTYVKVKGVGSFHVELNMVASMGNGFTFELMSIMLLAIARTFDPRASVYGDDIVICKEKSLEFTAFLSEYTDYVVNEEKSFFDGVIRESCGAYFVADREITRYDVKWCTSFVDCITTVNKLQRISAFLMELNMPMCTDVAHSLRKLALACRAEMRGPFYFEGKRGVPAKVSLTDAGLKYHEIPNRETTLSLFVETDEPERTCLPKAIRKRLREWQEKHQNYSNYVVKVPTFGVNSSRRYHRTVTQCRSGDPRAFTVLLKTHQLPDLLKKGEGTWQWQYAICDDYGVVDFLGS